MAKSKTSYLIRDIDKGIWKKFRGICYVNGYDSAGDCLIKYIISSVKDYDRR